MKTSTADISELFTRALETAAFVSPLPAEEGMEAPRSAVMVRVAIAGSEFGAFEMIAAGGLGVLLVNNLLGTEDDAQDLPTLEDALKELANVTCGLILSRVSGGSRRFEMGVPLTQPFDAARDWNAFVTDPSARCFTAEGNPVAIRLRGVA